MLFLDTPRVTICNRWVPRALDWCYTGIIFAVFPLLAFVLHGAEV